jgi:hypothetical protein
MSNQVQYINPDGLSKNPAFSQVVTTHGKGKTIYVGGQDAINARGEIIGKGDIVFLLPPWHTPTFWWK